MAIITDATGRQLAQAVGGIDTGGLAKDTTLQATNTALGNMNSSQQAIASAISGLGQTLGSDRALIDGSNIGNKGAFREAIGMQFTPTTAVIRTPLSGYSSYADLVIAEDGCYSFKTYTNASSPVNLVLSLANGRTEELWGYVQINAPQYTTIHSPILWLKKGTYKLRATGDHLNMYKYS